MAFSFSSTAAPLLTLLIWLAPKLPCRYTCYRTHSHKVYAILHAIKSMRSLSQLNMPMILMLAHAC